MSANRALTEDTGPGSRRGAHARPGGAARGEPGGRRAQGAGDVRRPGGPRPEVAQSPAASLAAVALCVLLKAQEGHEQVLKERVGREPGAIVNSVD